MDNKPTLNERLKEVLGPAKPPRNAHKAPKARGHNGATGGDDRPEIRIEGGKLHENVAQAMSVLIAAMVDIYQRAGALVRVARLDAQARDKATAIPEGSLVILPVVEQWLTCLLTALARWLKFDKRENEWRPIDAPSKIANAIIAQAGGWAGVRVLRGVTACPTLRADGSLLIKPGYDEASGLYLDYQGPPVVVPDAPTKADALAALDVLLYPLREFPFQEPVDLSVVLSGILTAIARPTLPSAPLHAYSATDAGSGKSLIVDIISIIVTGRPAAVMSQGKDEGEDEKRLGALLHSGVQIIAIDNVEMPLRGDLLCSILTQRTVSIRILGQSATVQLPTNVAIFATGNNLAVSGDMKRRVLMATIDPQCERPDSRQFDLNLHEYIPQHRHELIVAALTILRAYVVAGRPRQTIKPFGSFEAWSDLVRSALVWLGQPDPCLTRERLEEADSGFTALSRILALWSDTLDTSRAYSAAELIDEAEQGTSREWRDALMEIAASLKGADRIDARRLGLWLKKHRGRVVGGLRIERWEDAHAKIALWRLVPVAGSAGNCGSATTNAQKNGRVEMTNYIEGPGELPQFPAVPAVKTAVNGLNITPEELLAALDDGDLASLNAGQLAPETLRAFAESISRRKS